MKKRVLISFTFVVVIILILVFYIKMHNNKEAVVKINYDNIKHADIENIAQNYWNSDGIYNIAAAEDGYYYVTNEDFLVYFDINTGDTVPVCAKPDCMHDNDECNACLNTCVIYNIYYYNEYIYYMPIINGMANLCRMDKSGSTTKILGELFPSDGSSSIHLAFLGDYAYAYDSGSHLGLDTEFTEKIVEVSLKNGERNEIYDVTGVSLAIKNVKGFGDGLYFNVQHSERSDENISISSYGLYMYSQSEKNVSQISTENINDYYLSDNYLYYFINGQGLYKSDIENQKTELIYKSNKAVDMCNISYDGRYLYISNGKYCDYLRKVLGNKEKKYIVIDTDGKVINEISCADSLEMLFGDDRYLFCMGMGEDQLMYMDKREIEKAEEWKNIFSEPVHLLGR